MKKEALFYTAKKEMVYCHLCPHQCVIPEGHVGRCQVRINERGKLYSLNFGAVTALSLDPIEKKPLHHFHPGSMVLSAGTFGCNLTCRFCQNHEISQRKALSQYLSVDALLDLVLDTPQNLGLAFTYNEPTIWYEYIWALSQKIKKSAPYKKILWVTNGFIEKEPLLAILPWIDAMNIDLKSFSEDFYSQICGAHLKPMQETISLAASHCHVEVTTLIVTGHNDRLEEVEDIAKFLSQIDPFIPLHLSRYFPRYQMDERATDISFLFQAKERAQKYLHRVSLGNLG